MATMHVLVLAVGGNVSQGILKALRYDARPKRIVGADISPLQMGLYTVDKALIAPWAHEDAFIPWLLETCQREQIDVILSGCEPVLLPLARHEEAIRAKTGTRCILSPLPVMELGDDKLATCQWLATNHLPHPRFADASDDAAIDQLLGQTDFPLVAKPRHGGGARGVFLVDNPEALAYARSRPDYLLQEYLSDDTEEYTVGCFRDRDGVLAPSCCMRRDIQAGTTVRAEIGAFPDVRAVAEQIVDTLAPLGPCNVQLRVTDQGPLCFEINPRFSGTTPIRTHFGYREVSAALDHFIEGKPPSLTLLTEGIAVRYWNELYVNPDAHRALIQTGNVEARPENRSPLEDYGVHQS